jgi:hypothetical protein
VTNQDPTAFTFDFGNSQSPKDGEIAPAFFMCMQTTNGGDTATVRYQDLTFDEVTVRVEEEASANDELDHNDEEIGLMVLRLGAFSS